MSVLDARATPLLCGHRGAAATHPENTLVSIEAALDAGCDAVEVDVHVTADSRLAVIHDATVDRTTHGTGAVASMTSGELLALDVPMLDDVLALCRARHALTFVEMKAAFDAAPGAADLAAAAVDRGGMRDGALLLAFDHRHLTQSRRTAAWLSRVALCDVAPADPVALLEPLDAEAIAPSWSAVDARLCDRVHDAGRRVVTWTVDDTAVAQRLVRMGVDVVITNDPLRLGAALRSEVRR